MVMGTLLELPAVTEAFDFFFFLALGFPPNSMAIFLIMV